MKSIKADILIIGAGLTGLTIAYLLRKQNKSVKIIEARARVGGRIYTKYNSNLAPLEMGATWFGKKHTALVTLLEDLKIGNFEQQLGDKAIYEAISTSPPQLVTLPPNDNPSYRIQGGTTTIIEALTSHFDESQLFLNEAVNTIEEKSNEVVVSTQNHCFKANKVISTLPPNLLLTTITCTPNLPAEVINIGKQTHTWMGESIKIALTYDTPFWRQNSSGTIVSNVGPIPEMYDHSNVENDRFALKGFLNGSYYSLTKTERLELVMKQLEKYYGMQARNFLTYEEVIWREESFTFTDYSTHILPHQNNGHPIFRQPFMNEKLWIAGSETAEQFAGYMDGAIRSAIYIIENL